MQRSAQILQSIYEHAMKKTPFFTGEDASRIQGYWSCNVSQLPLFPSGGWRRSVSHTNPPSANLLPDGFGSAYLGGVVVSVWATHGPRGGDGAGLTVSIRRPESRLLQPAGERTDTSASAPRPGPDGDRCTHPRCSSGDLDMEEPAVWISLSVNSRQPRTSAQTGITVVARGTDRHHPPAVVLASLGWRLSLPHGESFESSCRRASHSPVLKLLAVDAHSPLVALGDTDLVSAALNLLTWVLSGVYVCGIARKKERCLLKNPHLPGYFLPSFCICSLKSQISLFAQHNLRARRNYQRYTELHCTILWHKSS